MSRSIPRCWRLKRAMRSYCGAARKQRRATSDLVEIMSAIPGMPEGAIELLDASTRQSVQELIKARGLVDVIIPRGGAGLITFVTENSPCR